MYAVQLKGALAVHRRFKNHDPSMLNQRLLTPKSINMTCMAPATALWLISIACPPSVTHAACRPHNEHKHVFSKSEVPADIVSWSIVPFAESSAHINQRVFCQLRVRRIVSSGACAWGELSLGRVARAGNCLDHRLSRSYVASSRVLRETFPNQCLGLKPIERLSP